MNGRVMSSTTHSSYEFTPAAKPQPFLESPGPSTAGDYMNDKTATIKFSEHLRNLNLSFSNGKSDSAIFVESPQEMATPTVSSKQNLGSYAGSETRDRASNPSHSLSLQADSQSPELTESLRPCPLYTPSLSPGQTDKPKTHANFSPVICPGVELDNLLARDGLKGAFKTVYRAFGPAEQYSWNVICYLNDEEIAKASGRRKTEAYVEASRIVLAKLRGLPRPSVTQCPTPSFSPADTGVTERLEEIFKVDGPPHNPTWNCILSRCGRIISQGTGANKKEARQDARLRLSL
ncbi:hypothetical protein DFH11DRAFT_356155 [Phellopilus nigrolimitatus]|nr:hypothetical protein DFH11DRAFT_356155 [Phellopilus nigrolimitatus]